MKDREIFSISETAKIVGMTSETLRHYDRINLVRPSATDERTGYRRYSLDDMVRLNTVRILRCMGMTLSEIRDILSYEDFGKITDALQRAEKSADDKIAELTEAKAGIRRAMRQFENKPCEDFTQTAPFEKVMPERVVLLSDKPIGPSADILWNYHRHFYGQLPENIRDDFRFEDAAGIYERGGVRRMFAVCAKYRAADGITILPRGAYLCAYCTDEERERTTAELLARAKNEYGANPGFAALTVIVTGILKWRYRAEVFLHG